MVKLKGLGRGLDALLASDIETAISTEAMRSLNVAQMQPGKYQPRSFMDDAALQTLADSIKSHRQRRFIGNVAHQHWHFC